MRLLAAWDAPETEASSVLYRELVYGYRTRIFPSARRCLMICLARHSGARS